MPEVKESPSDEGPAYGPELEGFSYPWPVSKFEFVGQRVPLRMAYMDVKPTTPNGRVVVCCTERTTSVCVESNTTSDRLCRNERSQRRRALEA
jgi:hypothetical protein